MAGISAKTATDMMLASGAYVTIDAVDMGALSGTIDWVVETEYYTPVLYGAKGPVVGTIHIVQAVPKITFRMQEWEYAKFQEIWENFATATCANSEKIGDGVLGLIATAEYHAVQILGATLYDTNVVQIDLDDAYISNSPGSSFNDRENAIIEVELTGTYLTTAVTTLPFSVQIDKG